MNSGAAFSAGQDLQSIFRRQSLPPLLTLSPRGKALGEQAGPPWSLSNSGALGTRKEFFRESPRRFLVSTGTTSAIQPITIGNKRPSAAASTAALACGGHPSTRHHQASPYYRYLYSTPYYGVLVRQVWLSVMFLGDGPPPKTQNPILLIHRIRYIHCQPFALLLAHLFTFLARASLSNSFRTRPPLPGTKQTRKRDKTRRRQANDRITTAICLLIVMSLLDIYITYINQVHMHDRTSVRCLA